jgi:type IV fimbrial biogenesis protein FimT
MKPAPQQGFSLLELMVSVAILALVLVLGVPSMSAAMEKRRTIAAAEQIYSQLQLARFMSVARSQQVFANIVAGSTWAMGVSDNSACDPSDNAPVCQLPDMSGSNAVTQIVSAVNFSNIALATSAAQITFSPQRATASTAAIDITSSGDMGYAMRVEVSLLGHIGVCSPADPVTYVSGYREC